ncbi:hypothetical protein L2E82_42207 [Cichorium intybus]|uniref:Uncharacterized protein n=1 Tax=Cichorium intybus TaxID=13427 RepID=A0ACB8ZKT6_CICIN|nr:hypothetical protein L2E82_42207 [Cichorium intybus]
MSDGERGRVGSTGGAPVKLKEVEKESVSRFVSLQLDELMESSRGCCSVDPMAVAALSTGGGGGSKNRRGWCYAYSSKVREEDDENASQARAMLAQSRGAGGGSNSGGDGSIGGIGRLKAYEERVREEDTGDGTNSSAMLVRTDGGGEGLNGGGSVGNAGGSRGEGWRMEHRSGEKEAEEMRIGEENGGSVFMSNGTGSGGSGSGGSGGSGSASGPWSNSYKSKPNAYKTKPKNKPNSNSDSNRNPKNDLSKITKTSLEGLRDSGVIVGVLSLVEVPIQSLFNQEIMPDKLECGDSICLDLYTSSLHKYLCNRAMKTHRL